MAKTPKSDLDSRNYSRDMKGLHRYRVEKEVAKQDKADSSRANAAADAREKVAKARVGRW